ncbi:MAG: hypothetical protein ABI856_16100 [Nitrospira sp.]
MHELHKELQNPLTRDRDSRDRTRVAKAFPDFQSHSELHFLALRRYLDGCPERFFDKTVYENFLDWHQRRDGSDGKALKLYFSQFNAEINRALLFLREINSEKWHDRPLGKDDEYELIRFIDKLVHPTYLRLIEAVMTPLIRPVAYFSRLDRGKSVDGLHVWSVVQELEQGPADCLIQPYRQIIRNGIAHGGIMFLQNAIRYRDKKGNEETFGAPSVVRLFDDLLDTCNGLAAALKVFFLISRDRGYIPPSELLLEELQEVTWTPWWTIEGCVESEVAGKSQLIVYARPDSRHYEKVHWSTIQSGILAEFFAPGHDRYFFSLRSRKAWPGWAAFDGKKLRNLREAGAVDLSQYCGILENNLIFYVARPAMPAFFGKLDTFVKSFRLNMPIVMQQIREKIGIPLIVCRNSAVHRNSWGAVLNAEVVVEGLDDETALSVIRKYRRRIIKSAIKGARRDGRLNGAAYLPVGYAHVAVFRRDYRRRRLSGFDLGDDLVCTVRFQRMCRIKSPDIIGSTVEIMGKWRIAWNKEWLETSGQNLTDDFPEELRPDLK